MLRGLMITRSRLVSLSYNLLIVYSWLSSLTAYFISSKFYPLHGLLGTIKLVRLRFCAASNIFASAIVRRFEFAKTVDLSLLLVIVFITG